MTNPHIHKIANTLGSSASRDGETVLMETFTPKVRMWFLITEGKAGCDDKNMFLNMLNDDPYHQGEWIFDWQYCHQVMTIDGRTIKIKITPDMLMETCDPDFYKAYRNKFPRKE